MCGADLRLLTPRETLEGSPPRVRSRRPGPDRPVGRGGITSACAEQTEATGRTRTDATDHLRVCGADEFITFMPVTLSGSPPRVRSRLNDYRCLRADRGITSACAEQTDSPPRAWPPAQDHLRVCGADLTPTGSKRVGLGSPPRVRSRLAGHQTHSRRTGITSACAEQTRTSSSRKAAIWDHLRVCGADNPMRQAIRILLGSPPRVRSRPRSPAPRFHVGGITSACAEQTGAISAVKNAVSGSPPRVRSRPATRSR